MDSFIIQLWGTLLGLLKWLSPLELIWAAAPRLRTHGWVDVWVLTHLALSVGAVVAAARLGPTSWLTLTLVVYGVIRLQEIVVYQAKVVLFDMYRQPRSTSDYAVRGYRRLVLLALHNYLEIVFWFAAIYSILRCDFGEKAQVLSTVVGATYYSMVTMATLGYGEITPVTDSARVAVLAHLVIAVFVSLLIFARFVAFLPNPRSLDSSEQPPS